MKCFNYKQVMHQIVKTGNASDRLLKEVKQIFLFNVSSKKIAKNIYNTIIKSIKKTNKLRKQ